VQQLPFDGVLFDCDGILVDSEPITNGVLHEMLGELGWGLSAEECIDRFVGRSLRDEFGVIEEHTGFLPTGAWLDEFRARRDVALVERVEAVPGVVDAVRAVAAAYGSRFAVASGADRSKVLLQLTKIGLADAFGERVFSGMETARSKPAPDVYVLAASTIGVDPARSVVVEDSVPGVQAGVAAGATVIGFAPEGPARTPASVLREAGATHVITDMRELSALVLG
jgi:HAD superfamily hydrolase (TIGR01509 family)